jgi:hypothetical protein
MEMAGMDLIVRSSDGSEARIGSFTPTVRLRMPPSTPLRISEVTVDLDVGKPLAEFLRAAADRLDPVS